MLDVAWNIVAGVAILKCFALTMLMMIFIMPASEWSVKYLLYLCLLGSRPSWKKVCEVTSEGDKF